ncbi:MAG: glutathione peroxidase [Balneolales bacterium]
MKIIALLLLFMISSLTEKDTKDTSVIYTFTPNNIQGETTPLSQFEGKTLLIVNTASKCGNTKQYAQLQELYNKYKENGLVILGFPADNFGGQEPGTDEEILEFCTLNFNVSFPMFSKISVKGQDQDPLFKWLTNAENPDFTGDIDWNFEKFLISPDGKLARRFRPKVQPMGDEITQAIENLAVN